MLDKSYHIKNFKIQTRPDTSGYFSFHGSIKKNTSEILAKSLSDKNAAAALKKKQEEDAAAALKKKQEEEAAAAALKKTQEEEEAAAAAAAALKKKKEEEAAKVASSAFASKPPPKTRVSFPTTAAEADNDAIKRFNELIASKENAIRSASNNRILNDIITNLSKIQRDIYKRFPDESEEKTKLINKIDELKGDAATKKQKYKGGTRKQRKNLRKTRKNRR